MKKLLVLLVAFFLATTAYALNETASNGPQHITSCYMIGTGPVTSGNVVVLTDDADTTRTIAYPGKEVTYSTASERIYGVIVDTNNYTAADMALGQNVRVQVYGYCPTIACTNGVAITAGYELLTDGGADTGEHASTNQGRAQMGGLSAAVSSNAVALSATVGASGQTTTDGWLNW